MRKEKLKEALKHLVQLEKIKDCILLADYFNSNGFNPESVSKVAAYVEALCKDLDPVFKTTNDCLELYVKVGLGSVQIVDELTANTWTIKPDLTSKLLAELIVSCRTSRECHDCYNCEHCNNCYKSRNLVYCDNCYRCEDCDNCTHCTDCEYISGASFAEGVTGNR